MLCVATLFIRNISAFGVETSELLGESLSFALETPANFYTRPVRVNTPMITTGGFDENRNDVEWFDCFSRASLRVVAPPSARHQLLTLLAPVFPLATSALQPGCIVETLRRLRDRLRSLCLSAQNNRWHSTSASRTFAVCKRFWGLWNTYRELG